MREKRVPPIQQADVPSQAVADHLQAAGVPRVFRLHPVRFANRRRGNHLLSIDTAIIEVRLEPPRFILERCHETAC